MTAARRGFSLMSFLKKNMTFVWGIFICWLSFSTCQLKGHLLFDRIEKGITQLNFKCGDSSTQFLSAILYKDENKCIFFKQSVLYCAFFRVNKGFPGNNCALNSMQLNRHFEKTLQAETWMPSGYLSVITAWTKVPWEFEANPPLLHFCAAKWDSSRAITVEMWRGNPVLRLKNVMGLGHTSLCDHLASQAKNPTINRFIINDATKFYAEIL